MDKLTKHSKICDLEPEACDSCYDSENDEETTCSSSAKVQQAPLRRSRIKRFQARAQTVRCDDIDEAQQIFCEFKKVHKLEGWLGYEGDELVIVAFSNKKIPNFPTFFQTLRIVLRTDDDNDKRIERVPRLIKDDVKYCKEIIQKYGPILMDRHSNISMIIPSSYRLQNGVPIANVCIAIYCRGKGVIPLNEELFPTSLELVEVDVREGYCSFGMKNEELSESGEYHQNLRIGVEIGVSGGPINIGTLGGFLYASGETLFLTCAHVVIPQQCLLSHYPEYKYTANRCYTCKDIDVYQPAMDRISVGKVKNAIFQHSSPGITSVDAAIIYITDETRIPTDPFMTKQPSNTNQLRAAGFSMNNPPHFSTGKIMPQMDEPSIGHMVVKCGTITGLTHGLLALDGGIFRLENQELRLAGLQGQNFQRRITMYGQYLVESIHNLQFFDLGDSGSLVFMHDEYKSLKCIGMAVGMTTHGGCIVTPIEAILNAFGIHDDDNGPPFLPFNDGDDDYGDDDSDENRFDEKRRKYPNKPSRQPDNHHSRMDHSGLDINSETRQRKQPRYRPTSKKACVENYLHRHTEHMNHEDSTSIDLPFTNSSYCDSNDGDDDSGEDYRQPRMLATADKLCRQSKQNSNKDWTSKANLTFLSPTDNPHNYKEKGKKFRSGKNDEVKHAYDYKTDNPQVNGDAVISTVSIYDHEIHVSGKDYIVFNHVDTNKRTSLIAPESKINTMQLALLLDHSQIDKKKKLKSQEMFKKPVILNGFIYFCLALFKTIYGNDEEFISSQSFDRFVRYMSDQIHNPMTEY